MKISDVPLWVRRFLISIFLIIILIGVYLLRCNFIYNSIDVTVSKNVKVEYGTANYSVEDLLDDISGDEITIIRDIDTTIVGEQEVIFEVSKSNITKEIPIKVEVVDSVGPVINLKNDVIYVNCGSSYNLNDNISSVTDVVDGSINYKNINDVKEGDLNYYTISPVDYNSCGTKDVEVSAVDKYGNLTLKHFKVKVISHGKEKTISDIAYSLLGSPYVAGGNSPSGFDCSGFVQYVYARAGIKVSRGASRQLHDGYGVSYGNARVGDILIWGYGNVTTHSAIYVGNGLMIHAANPKQGVVIDKVNGWGDYNGVYILSVRRLK